MSVQIRPYTCPKVIFDIDGCKAYSTEELNSYSTPGTYSLGHVHHDFCVLISDKNKKYYHFSKEVAASWTKHSVHELVKFWALKNNRRYYIDCEGVKKLNGHLIAPKGYKFEGSQFGLRLVRLSDGADFHPYNIDITIEKCLEELDKNYQKKLETEKQEILFKKCLDNTIVTFQDARKAGNCVQGILSWAKNKLNLEKDQIFAAKIPANILYRLAPEDFRVKNSIICAIQRETIVCI